MIIDTLENASKYFTVHPLFEQAFKYIQQTNLANTPDGKYDISEGLKAIFSNAQGKTREASIAKFECHNNHIDIQVCIAGKEELGWKPRAKCLIENGAYNPDKDVQLYSDTPDMYFHLTDDQFAIFFPEDVHAPMISDGYVYKLVVKVKI